MWRQGAAQVNGRQKQPSAAAVVSRPYTGNSLTCSLDCNDSLSYLVYLSLPSRTLLLLRNRFRNFSIDKGIPQKRRFCCHRPTSSIPHTIGSLQTPLGGGGEEKGFMKEGK